MLNQKKFVVSHAPFCHNGNCICERSYNIMLAALPAVLMAVYYYGLSALGVVALSISSAMFWEVLFNRLSKRPDTVGDGSAALIGMIFAMMMPPVAPWWMVIVGTFAAVVLGRQIFGGIGANPFNSAVLAIAVLTISWPMHMDFNAAVVNCKLDFAAVVPLAAIKHAGLHTDLFNVKELAASFSPAALFMGKQVGAIGATFGLGIILGGIYLILRGFIRWEISVSFLIGVAVTSLLFSMSAPERYAGPMIHLLSGYTLLAAFFLATEDSSSPVNCVPMLIYGLVGGMMTVLIRNIGVYADGVIYAILVINLINPLLDKIRPKALGKVC